MKFFKAFLTILTSFIFISCSTFQESVSPALSLQNGQQIGFDTLAVAPNNRIILIGSKVEQEIFLWDSSSGKILSHLKIPFQSIAFSKNSRYLALGLSNGAIIWDLYQNKILHNLTSSIPTGSFVKFSPEGLYLLTGSFKRNDTPMFWDIVNGEMRIAFEIFVSNPEEIQDVQKLIDDRKYAEAYNSVTSMVRPLLDDTIYLRNFLETWQTTIKRDELRNIGYGNNTNDESNDFMRNEVAYKVFKRFLDEIESEKTIDKSELQKISSELAKKNPTYSGHFQSLNLSSISADKKTFATLDKSGNLHFWNLATSEMKNALSADTSSTVSSFSFVNSENATYLVQVNQQKKESILTIWDLYSSEIRTSFSESSAIVNTAIDSKLKKVFYLTKEKLVSLSLENSARQQVVIPNANSFAYSESLKQIFVATASSIQVFHADTFQKVREIKTPEKLFQLEIGTKLLAGLGTSKIYIWDLDNDSLLHTVTKETAKVSSIKLSKKDQYLGIGFELGAVEVYDAKKGNFLFGSEVTEKKLFTLNKERPNVKEIIDEYFFSNKLQDTYYKLKGDQYIIYTYTQGHRSSVTSLDFSSDEKYLLSTSANSGSYTSDANIILWDLKSESIDTYLNSEFAQVTKGEFTSSGKNFLVSTADGSIELYDTDGKKELTFLKPAGTGDALIVLKDLRYQLFGTRNLKGVGFAYKGRGYGFEQFDLGFNQPDSVVERLAAIFSWKDKSIANRIERFRKYREARIKNNGFTSILSDPSKFHAPEVKILSRPDKQVSKEEKISVRFRSSDSSGKNLIGYKIFVNGVPIYGDYVRRKSPDGKEIFTKELELTDFIVLASGENKIEISSFTEDGVESPRESFSIVYEPAVKKKPSLYLVAIGIDQYDLTKSGGLDTLTYAVKDAKEITQLLEESAKGKYLTVQKRILTNGEVTRDAVIALKDFLNQSSVDDTVVLFLSGHGIRKETKVGKLIESYGKLVPPQYESRSRSDKDDVYYYMTSTANVDSPWDSAIPLDLIRELVSGIPARQKLLFVDTCQSGEKLEIDDSLVASVSKELEDRKLRGSQARGNLKFVVTRGKRDERGIAGIQSYASNNTLKEMSNLFPELRRGTGTIEISAATGAQSALESNEWQNGAFTYVIKEAIRKGKAKNQKGKITAQSLRKYVLERVEELTDGQQTPMVARDIAGRDFILFE